MTFKLHIEDDLKKELKNTKARALVDKNVGGKLLDLLKSAFRNITFVHVGTTPKSDATDDEIVSYAREEGYNIIVTMDYGMARKAILGDLAVILIFGTEKHDHYVITYLARLGEIRFVAESTL